MGWGGNKIYNHTRMSIFNKTQISNSLNTTPQAIEFPNEDPSNTNTVSTRYLEDGGFLRLNNATIGYNFKPELSLMGDWITNIRLSLTGQNLFVITNYSGFDPELNTGTSSDSQSYGIDYFHLSKTTNARTWLKRILLNFKTS